MRILIVGTAVITCLAGLAGAAVAKTHRTVRPGDTLAGLAADNGHSVAELATVNDLSDPNLITVGSTLVVDDFGNVDVSGAQPPVVTGSGSADWAAINQCEAGGRWNGVPGYYEGGLQFDPGTWDAYAPAGYPASGEDATPSQQIAVGEAVLAAQGPGAWPNCFQG